MLWNYKKYCIIDHGSDTFTKPDFLLLDAVPHFAFSVVSISLTVCAVNVPNKLVWLGAALPTGLHWYRLISRLGDTGAGRRGSHFPMYYLPPPPMSLSLFIEILFGIGREAKLLIFFHFRIVWDFLLLSVAAHMTMNANYSRVHRLTIATSHNLIATSIESPHAISGKLGDWERVLTLHRKTRAIRNKKFGKFKTRSWHLRINQVTTNKKLIWIFSIGIIAISVWLMEQMSNFARFSIGWQ